MIRQPISLVGQGSNGRVNQSVAIPEEGLLPAAYRLPEGMVRQPVAPHLPRVVFIEVTNNCNLLCQTCPRTYFTREPLRSLIYVAAERAVKDVYIDGRLVVKDGQVQTLDYDTASQALDDAQARVLRDVGHRDWAKRSIEEISPLTFPRGQ